MLKKKLIVSLIALVNLSGYIAIAQVTIPLVQDLNSLEINGVYGAAEHPIWNASNSYYLDYYVERDLEYKWDWKSKWRDNPVAKKDAIVFWNAVWNDDKIYFYVHVKDNQLDTLHHNYKMYHEDDAISFWFEKFRNIRSRQWDWMYNDDGVYNHNHDINYLVSCKAVDSFYVQKNKLNDYLGFQSGSNPGIQLGRSISTNDSTWSIETIVSPIGRSRNWSKLNPILNYSINDSIWFNLTYYDADYEDQSNPEKRKRQFAWWADTLEKAAWEQSRILTLTAQQECSFQTASLQTYDPIVRKNFIVNIKNDAQITIDGKLDEDVWQHTIPIILTSHRNVADSTFAWKFWDNFSDAAVIWRSFWNSNTNELYLGFQIYDDYRDSTNLKSGNIIDDDGLLIFIDLNANNSYKRSEDINVLIHNSDATHIYFKDDSEKYKDLEQYIKIPIDEVQNIKFALETNPDSAHWFVEVKVTLDSSQDLTLKALPIEIGYNDADASGHRETQLIWNAVSKDQKPWTLANLGNYYFSRNQLISLRHPDPTPAYFKGPAWDYKNWKNVFWYYNTAINDSANRDTLGYSGNQKVTIAWNDAVDNQSGVGEYHIIAGSPPIDNDICDTTISADSTSLDILGTHGKAFVAKIIPKNGLNLIALPYPSLPVLIDTTAPSTPGMPQDKGRYTSSTLVTFNWTAAIDSESKIIDYQLIVGTTPGDSNVVNHWLSSTNDKKSRLSYTDTSTIVKGQVGQTLYAKVRAKNSARLIGDWSESSDGITILPIDVVFAFELSKSMVDNFNEIKQSAVSWINDMMEAETDTSFGLVSFVDYPGLFNSYNTYDLSYSCKYAAVYGEINDYPWKIHQQISKDNDNAITNLITSLKTLSGGDGPQSYSRALLECLFLNWRKDARKFLVVIGNNPAHDCDYFAMTYGKDPGPDAKLDTWDDLNYELVIDWLGRAGITILSIDNSIVVDSTFLYKSDIWKNFEYMATQTGGLHFYTEHNDNIFQAIEMLIERDGLKPENLYPDTSEAEKMFNRKLNYGMPCDDGWKFKQQDKPIYNGVVFLRDSVYRFNVTAQPESADKKFPWLKIQANEVSGAVEVNQAGWNDYSFNVHVPKGFHCLSLTFLNDWWDEHEGDLNLLIDKVTVNYHSGQTDTAQYVFEAEGMSTHSDGTYGDNGFWVLNTLYAHIAHNFYFEKEQLDCKIIAKADSFDGDWPGMHVILDDKVITSFVVDKSDNIDYQFSLSGIEPGNHRIKIAYDNNRYHPGRKLYVDKLIIYVKDGSLLKSENERPVANELHSMLPENYDLAQNSPNPFNPDTYIKYQLPEDAHVMIKIFNTIGQEIITLVDMNRKAGFYSVYWNGLDQHGNPVGSGIYLYQIRTKKFLCTRKMIMLK